MSAVAFLFGKSTVSLIWTFRPCRHNSRNLTEEAQNPLSSCCCRNARASYTTTTTASSFKKPTRMASRKGTWTSERMVKLTTGNSSGMGSPRLGLGGRAELIALFAVSALEADWNQGRLDAWATKRSRSRRNLDHIAVERRQWGQWGVLLLYIIEGLVLCMCVFFPQDTQDKEQIEQATLRAFSGQDAWTSRECTQRNRSGMTCGSSHTVCVLWSSI